MATYCSIPKIEPVSRRMAVSGRRRQWKQVPILLFARSQPALGSRIARYVPRGMARSSALLALALLLFFSTAPRAEDSYRLVDGLAVYLGVLPSQLVQGHNETTMHGGVRRGLHQHHVLVALFDVTSGARMIDAEVTAAVSLLPGSGESKRLGTMIIADTVTYGQYFEFANAGSYTIRIDIRRAGRTTPLTTRFVYQHSLQ